MTIVIATHKPCSLPENELYLPLQVGADLLEEDFGYAKDNSGENISPLNYKFCELTALYWAWKNLNNKSIGLEQYRRRFVIDTPLDERKVYVPKKRYYVIESLYSHYDHTHTEAHLAETKNIIDEMYPEYSEAFSKALSKRSGYMFNMFIMPKELLDDYCSWLFPILFELDRRNDSSRYSAFDKRYIGRVGELLFNVWITRNRIRCCELNYTEYGLSFFHKLKRYLKARISGKSYSESA